MMKFAVIFSIALFAVASALPLMVEDEEGQQYYLEPVESEPTLSRNRREADKPKLPGPNDPKLFGEYNANRQLQSGRLSYRNPDGSGVDIAHGHFNGFGNTVSLDGRIPIWSNKNAYGESTLNLGVGGTQHYGGWPGNQNLDKRFGLSFNHRF